MCACFNVQSLRTILLSYSTGNTEHPSGSVLVEARYENDVSTADVLLIVFGIFFGAIIFTFLEIILVIMVVVSKYIYNSYQHIMVFTYYIAFYKLFCHHMIYYL